MGILAYKRTVLVAGAVTPITPPRCARKVVIGNATNDDVRIMGDPNDTGNFATIAAGFERTLSVGDGTSYFAPELTAFYLNAVSGGTVVLEWM